MSNETGQEKKRLKTLVDSGIRYVVCNGKRRRLCDKCEKWSQRERLCARHLTETKKQQQLTRNITASHQSSAPPTTEELNILTLKPLDLVALIKDYKKQNTSDDYGEFFCFINIIHLKASLSFNIFYRKYSKNNDANTSN
jgi:hypothetical protein